MLPPSAEQRRDWIARIAALPDQLEALVRDLTPAQLNAAPAPNEWSPRQVVHHLADSHMNAFIRLKIALTETNPMIRPYDQVGFALLPDTAEADISPSLALLRALHSRWVYVLEHLHEEDWARTFSHPEYGPQTIATQAESYAEHGENHLCQIKAALAAN
ncbi:MAG: putative metal-dependent hydrolase [Anaerolineae bacterium]|nr:putative metal-dependent hydrolase [Anaerolineae bacterium]